MKIITKRTGLDLSENEVTIMTNEFIVGDDGVEYKLDTPMQLKVYKNSVSGREDIINSDLPQNIKDGILKVWGDEPTVAEPQQEASIVEPENPESNEEVQ